ncbi:MAG: hypothetical protein QXK45_06690 [Thermofilaceae archaeon]
MPVEQRWGDLWSYWGQATGILPPVRDLAQLLYEHASMDAPEDDPNFFRITMDPEDDAPRVLSFLAKHRDLLHRAVLAVMMSSRALPKGWQLILELPDFDISNRLEHSVPLATIADSVSQLAVNKLFIRALERGTLSPFFTSGVDELARDIQDAIYSALAEKYGLATNIEDIYVNIRSAGSKLVKEWATVLPTLRSVGSWFIGPWKAPNIHTLDFYDLRQFLGDVIEKHWSYVQSALKKNKVSDPFALRRAIEAAQKGDAEGYFNLVGFIFTDLRREVDLAYEKKVAEARAQNKEAPPHPALQTALALAEYAWRLAPLEYLFFPFTGPVAEQLYINEFFRGKITAYDLQQFRQLLSVTMTIPGSKGLILLNPFLVMTHKNVTAGKAPMDALVRSGLMPRIQPYMVKHIQDAIIREGFNFGLASIYAAAWNAFQDYISDLVVNRYVLKIGSAEALSLSDPSLVRLRQTPDGTVIDIAAASAIWTDEITGTKVPILAQHGDTLLSAEYVQIGRDHFVRFRVPEGAEPSEITLKFVVINPRFDEIDLAFFDLIKWRLKEEDVKFTEVFEDGKKTFPENSGIRMKYEASKNPLQGLWVLLRLAPLSIWRKPGCNPLPDHVPPDFREYLSAEEVYQLKLEREAFHRFIRQEKEESLKLWENLMVRLLQPWIHHEIVERAARETPMGYSIWDTLFSQGFEDDLRVVLHFVRAWANRLGWRAADGQPNPLTSNYINGWLKATADAIRLYEQAKALREELADETLAEMILREIYTMGQSETLRVILGGSIQQTIEEGQISEGIKP